MGVCRTSANATFVEVHAHQKTKHKCVLEDGASTAAPRLYCFLKTTYAMNDVMCVTPAAGEELLSIGQLQTGPIQRSELCPQLLKQVVRSLRPLQHFFPSAPMLGRLRHSLQIQRRFTAEPILFAFQRIADPRSCICT